MRLLRPLDKYHRWGINWNDFEHRPEGLFDVRDGKHTVGVLGCIACHSGRAAGQFIIGIGNKNVDVQQIGHDAFLMEILWKMAHFGRQESGDYREIQDSAMEFASTLANPNITNLTQGMVPTSLIRTWFYRMGGKPVPNEFNRAAVKVPHLFGYGEKRKVGQFCDGFGRGNHPGWAIAVELVAHQKVKTIRNYLPRVEAAEELIGDLLPPKYPFSIDAVRATRGKAKFEMTCAHCHGTYETDSGGLPIYKAPRYIPWEIVKTDRDRLEGATDEFLELVRTNPLNDVIQYNADKGKGYFAPRLHAIWARFPYLHNGSVPSIAALLTPPAKRPRAFSLRDAGDIERFDTSALGLTLPSAGSSEEYSLLKEGAEGQRDVYSVDRVGHSNQGHDFFTDLSNSEKGDLIEYLKTI